MDGGSAVNLQDVGIKRIRTPYIDARLILKSTLTLNDMLDYNFKETDIYDVIREFFSELNGNITKTIFDKSQSIKRHPTF